MTIGQNVTRIRNQNPWIPAHQMSGFDIMSIAQLILMGFGAYFLITKGKDIISKFLSSSSSGTSMLTHE